MSFRIYILNFRNCLPEKEQHYPCKQLICCLFADEDSLFSSCIVCSPFLGYLFSSDIYIFCIIYMNG